MPWNRLCRWRYINGLCSTIHNVQFCQRHSTILNTRRYSPNHNFHVLNDYTHTNSILILLLCLLYRLVLLRGQPGRRLLPERPHLRNRRLLHWRRTYQRSSTIRPRPPNQRRDDYYRIRTAIQRRLS